MALPVFTFQINRQSLAVLHYDNQLRGFILIFIVLSYLFSFEVYFLLKKMAYLADIEYCCCWFNKDSQVNPFYSRQLLKMGSIFASLHTKATIWDYQKITEQLPPPQ